MVCISRCIQAAIVSKFCEVFSFPAMSLNFKIGDQNVTTEQKKQPTSGCTFDHSQIVFVLDATAISRPVPTVPLNCHHARSLRAFTVATIAHCCSPLHGIYTYTKWSILFILLLYRHTVLERYGLKGVAILLALERGGYNMNILSIHFLIAFLHQTRGGTQHISNFQQ